MDHFGKVLGELRLGPSSIVFAVLLSAVLLTADILLLGGLDDMATNRHDVDAALAESNIQMENLSAAIGPVLDAIEKLSALRAYFASLDESDSGDQPFRFFNSETSNAGLPRGVADLARLTSVLRLQTEELDAVAAAYEGLAEVLDSVPNAWPIQSGLGVVTFEFGPAIHPFTETWYMHRGTDIAARPGLQVLAMARGTVSRLERDTNNFGLQVVVDHSYGFQTRYAHLNASLVKRGDVVQSGAPIGILGSSGLVTGPAVHVEIMVGGELVDPAVFLQMTKTFARKTLRKR